ncbi:MAG: hypothetical protein COW42_09225 [Deltaproteobacteria bacterium CG17_big_fil_post_rev_8_21_14_2_50_63_7]|nr:MAG: hypothetical protein COW42_09225 [Deltaproteobacteria bacterium CG17_big_fil_post_rev_8_21_14_2_50_63_7]
MRAATTAWTVTQMASPTLATCVSLEMIRKTPMATASPMPVTPSPATMGSITMAMGSRIATMLIVGARSAASPASRPWRTLHLNTPTMETARAAIVGSAHRPSQSSCLPFSSACSSCWGVGVGNTRGLPRPPLVRWQVDSLRAKHERVLPLVSRPEILRRCLMTRPRPIQKMIEEQVKRWALEQRRGASAAKELWPTITVSREFGSQGALVGELVAKQLGFSFWDQNIVRAISEETGARDALAASLDERARSGLDDLLADVILGRSATQREYLKQVVRIVGTIERHGAAVIVGRGAQFIVQKDCLSVRCICPIEERIVGYAERQNVDEKEAARVIKLMERDRQKFIRQHYDKDVTDPTHYDFLVNLGRLGTKAAASLIIGGYRAKFGKLPPKAQAD